MIRTCRALCLAVALTLAWCFSLQPVQSYYDDTHYSLTYYAARVCGYTPMQAHRAASANLSIDYAKATEPLQGYVAREVDQRPRVDFHAFRDSTRFAAAVPTRLTGDQAAAELAIAEHEQRLRQRALMLGNPGVLLHFVQDRISHWGYESYSGHWLNPATLQERLVPTQVGSGLVIERSLGETYLPNGGTPDWLSYRSDQVSRMVDNTLTELRQFLAARSSQRVVPCSGGDLTAVIVQLMRANPTPPTNDQYQNQLAGFLAKGGAMLTFLQERGVPEAGLAHGIVRQALLARRDVRPYPETRINYDLDIEGGPLNPENPGFALDAFTLVGDLKIKLRRPTTATSDVAVSVWAKPTRFSEPPYQLTCARARPDTIEAGPIVPNVAFDKLPVGELVVYAVGADGTVVKEEITLDARERQLVIDMPVDTEKARACGGRLTPIANQLCASAGSGPPATASIERDFQARAGEAESCRATHLTEANVQGPATMPAPPPRSKSGAGARIAGVIAGIGVGIAAAILTPVAEEDEPTRPTTTTTTTTTPTTTTPTSLRCSTRNCIVNALSGGCDCTGSVNAACPVTTTLIQRTVGGACFNNGMFCDTNLSCNNNRCERSSTEGGRCRFP